MTDGTPEMPAPAAPAATRTREKKAAARTIEQNLRTGTAPEAVARIAKGSASLGGPSRGSWKLVEPDSPGAQAQGNARQDQWLSLRGGKHGRKARTPHAAVNGQRE